MAFVAGKNEYLAFAGLDLTANLASEVRLGHAGGESDASTIGNNWQRFLRGQANAQFTVSGLWDSGTAATSLDSSLFTALSGGTKLYDFMPAGSAADRIRYRGNGILTSYEVGSPVGNTIPFSATIRLADTPDCTLLFVPTDIAGCLCWLAADKITGLNNGETVGTWADGSGQGNNVTQSTQANKPIYLTRMLNGRPVVRFDGVNDSLAAAAGFMGGATAATLFVVFTPNDTNYCVITTNSIESLWRGDDGNANWGLFCNALLSGYPTSMPSSGNRLLSAVAGATYEVFLDGTSKGTSAYVYANGSIFRLGSEGDDSRWFTGDIAEVIVYNTALSAANRARVQGYLAHKWAILI